MDEELVSAARRIERATGIAAAAVLAVAKVETNAVAYAAFGGRREPLIRFEGHYFDRLLGDTERQRARALGLASPKAGAVCNPGTQAGRWALLDRAAAIDADAAYAATSWGLGQVMGAHWKALGYASPAALAAEARRSGEGQLQVLAKFLAIGRLDRLLDAGDFTAFARRYNGPAYAKNAYHTKIAKALKDARQRLSLPPGKAPASLGRRALGLFSAAPAAFPDQGASEAAGEAIVSKGWLRRPAMLSSALLWLNLLPFVPKRTRSFSISTGPSSPSATIPAPSGSSPPS